RQVPRFEVSADEIYGALSVYIMMALVWGMAYRIVDFLVPGSFRSHLGHLEPWDLTYFSFVTLLTVGYGDIQPISRFAKSFPIIEAMMGVVYMAVFISRLVAMSPRQQPPGEHKGRG